MLFRFFLIKKSANNDSESDIKQNIQDITKEVEY